MHNSHSANWVMPTVEGLEQTTLVEPLTLNITGLQPQELKQLENEIAKSDIASRSAAA
jgi:beta-xylosidase